MGLSFKKFLFGFHRIKRLCFVDKQCRNKKVNGTRRASQAVPHPSTDRALRRLTSEFGWDRVYSTQYGR